MPITEWHADRIPKALEKAVMDGVEEWARVDVLPLADENCPTDSGTMKGSHAVIRKDRYVEIGYGGAAAAYTERQHEDMTLHHPSGKAKWLEDAFNDKLKELSTKVKSRMGGVL